VAWKRAGARDLVLARSLLWLLHETGCGEVTAASITSWTPQRTSQEQATSVAPQ
jgi:hypothetical protein